MSITARSGPEITYGITTYASSTGVTGAPADYNDQRGPNLSDLGYGLMDPRSAFNYANGAVVTQPVYGFLGGRGYVDAILNAASSVAIVSVTPSSSLAGTALTLAAASSARGTYSVAIIAPESGVTTGNLLTFDSSASGLRTNAFGVSATVNTWAPGWVAGRCVGVATSTGGDSNIVVHGRDVYGFKISESITIGNALSPTASYGGTGVKAFKQIDAVYNATTPVSTGIQVGLTDRIGFPLYVPYYGHDITVRLSSAAAIMNSAIVLSTANAVLASGSSIAQTATTADVRGLWLSSVALSTNYRVQIAVTPSASAFAAVSASDVSPLFGATQYSS